jgi:hypothetical protein
VKPAAQLHILPQKKAIIKFQNKGVAVSKFLALIFLSIAIAIMSDQETTEPRLHSLRYYDELLLSNSSRVVRDEGNNVDRVTNLEQEEEFSLCHLSGLAPFTFQNYWNLAFEDVAAMALAAHQLNTGDGSIVPEISGLNETCNVRFTVEFADTQFDGGVALNHVVSQINRLPDSPKPRRPCAFLGPYGSDVSIPVSIVTGLSGYPSISGASTSADLDDTSQHPLFGRTIPSDSDNSIPIIKYMREVLNVSKLAVIHGNDPYGNAFGVGLRYAAQIYAPDMEIISISLNDKEDSEKIAIQSLKETQFRFIFCLVFTKDTHDKLLTEAYNQGVAGNGKHNWFFGDSFIGNLDNRSFIKGSPLHLAYQGVGLLEITSGVKGMEAYDKYTLAMESLRTPEDLQYLGSLMPESDHPDYGTSLSFINDQKYLSAPLKSNYGPFFYEAAIATGLAACNAITEDSKLEGTTHFNQIVSSSFSGVSGTVCFDKSTGTRNVTTATYKVVNYLAEDEVDAMIGVAKHLVHFNHYNTDLFQDGIWDPQRDFIFNDGTANLPLDFPPLSETEEDHWTQTLIMPLVLAAVAFFAVWIFFERKRKQSDTLWYVKKEELVFSDPPEGKPIFLNLKNDFASIIQL